jgi:hypothetical protein
MALHGDALHVRHGLVWDSLRGVYRTQNIDVQRVPFSLLNVQLCSIHVLVCMFFIIENCIEPFKTRICGSQDRVTFLWEEAERASINIWLVRGLS